MNKNYLFAYLFITIATFLFTFSLLRFDNTIKYRSEVASKKVEEARITEDKKTIDEAILFLKA